MPTIHTPNTKWNWLVPTLLSVICLGVAAVLVQQAWFTSSVIDIKSTQSTILAVISTQNEFRLAQANINSEVEKRFGKLETNQATIFAEMKAHQKFDSSTYEKKKTNPERRESK
jgi:TRAP-type uncharacterized transport system fused permease subunit